MEWERNEMLTISMMTTVTTMITAMELLWSSNEIAMKWYDEYDDNYNDDYNHYGIQIATEW